MLVPYSYYEDEVRDGFYIHGLMKRAWAATIEVFEEVERICKKYDITYFAYAGTLLGAVRHKGFIPWDDDLDICMLREDYNRFIIVAEKEFKSSKWFSLLSIHNEPEYCKLFARVVNGRSVNFDSEYLDRFHGCPFSVGIDIFPLDYISRDKDEEESRCELVAKIDNEIDNILNIYNSKTDNSRVNSLEFKNRLVNKCIDNVEILCNARIDRSGNIINQLYLLMERNISKFNAEDCDEVAFMMVWLKSRGNRFKKEYYKYSIDVDFENIKIKIPAMYNVILKETYGDYFKIVHNGSMHDYPIYKDQIEFLKEKTGIEFPKYAFKSEDLVKNRIYDENMDQDRYLISQIRNSVKILEEAHSEITSHYSEKNIMLDILAQCQNMAIMLGNAIEEIKGESFEGIRYIEKYCEDIFHEYENVNEHYTMQNPESAIDIDLLNGCICKARDGIIELLNSKEIVIFIVNKAESWMYLEHLWNEESNKQNTDVKIIVTPYYYKNMDFTINKEVFEIEDFPKKLNVIDYRDYDVKKEQPDRIYIQNPFDQFNFTMTVPRDYYACNLKHYTDELIYVPDFRTDEVSETDIQSYSGMDHFVTMPGVVQADKVLVWSEKMKNTYVKKLTEFAGEDTQTIWENKIYYDERFYNKNLEEKEIIIPDEWKKLLFVNEGVKKKSILYYTSTNMIIEKGKEYIDKLRRVLKIFKDNQDVVVIWRAYQETNSQLGLIAPELNKEYEQIIAEYKREGWGILDDTKDVKYALSVCDGYYGDTGSIIQMCRNKKIPVMVQNVEV